MPPQLRGSINVEIAEEMIKSGVYTVALPPTMELTYSSLDLILN